MEEKNEKKEKKIVTRVFIVIALLSTYIMVFLLGRITNRLTLGIKDEEKPDDTVITEPTSKPTKKPISGTNQGGEDEEEIEIPDGIITLWEGDTKWEQLEQLNIFRGVFYEKDYVNKVAPGFYGTYEFAVENTWNRPVTYIISFEEENPDKVNMVYTVQYEDEYVLGNKKQSVYVDGVKLEQVTIPANSKVYYKLNWKWEDTAYDTEIGQKDSAEYKLGIKLQATVNG